MAIGPKVRKMLGPLERPISQLYRGAFVDIRAFVGQIGGWVSPTNILELGCGEGAVAEALVRRFPAARVTGIDVVPSVGRLYRGDTERISFRQEPIQTFAPRNLGVYDLLVICDVLHHIPGCLRAEILGCSGKVVAPGGH